MSVVVQHLTAQEGKKVNKREGGGRVGGHQNAAAVVLYPP